MNSVVEIKESNEHKFQILKETIREKEMQEKYKLKKKYQNAMTINFKGRKR